MRCTIDKLEWKEMLEAMPDPQNLGPKNMGVLFNEQNKPYMYQYAQMHKAFFADMDNVKNCEHCPLDAPCNGICRIDKFRVFRDARTYATLKGSI